MYYLFRKHEKEMKLIASKDKIEDISKSYAQEAWHRGDDHELVIMEEILIKSNVTVTVGYSISLDKDGGKPGVKSFYPG